MIQTGPWWTTTSIGGNNNGFFESIVEKLFRISGRYKTSIALDDVLRTP